MSEPMLPGMEDWVPEDETMNEEYPEDYTVYRVVDADGKVLTSNKNISGVYLDAGWARKALIGFKGNRYKPRWYKLPFRVQRATVKWEDQEA